MPNYRGRRYAALLGGGGGFDPIAALLSLDPHSLLIARPEYLGPTEAGLGAVAPGGAVGFIQNLGSSAAHPVQGTAANRPTYQTSGGAHWLESDNTNDGMAVTFSALTQPLDRVSAVRLLNMAADEQLYSGGTDADGALFSGGGTNLNLFSGSVLIGPDQPANGTDFVVTERHNGASSRIAINNEDYVTGDAGTNGADGLTLFAGVGASGVVSARAYALAQFTRALAEAEIALARKAVAALTPTLVL